MIAVIHPGPVLRIYDNGKLIAEVPLSVTAAQSLAIDLQLEAMRANKKDTA